MKNSNIDFDEHKGEVPVLINLRLPYKRYHHRQLRHECLCTISNKIESNISDEALLSSGRNVPTRSL